jgi:hypothetical protein
LGFINGFANILMNVRNRTQGIYFMIYYVFCGKHLLPRGSAFEIILAKICRPIPALTESGKTIYFTL